MNFMKNVCETCKVGGYFIGTCLDGEKFFQLLEDKEKGESYIIHKEKERMWEARKQYDTDSLEMDETCLGLKVGVFQESIGEMFDEYLVHFQYLQTLLENYGFQLASNVKNLPNSTGLFNGLFHQMTEQLEDGSLKKNKTKTAANMSEEEKELSFLNRYFVFEKKLAVDADEVYATFIK